VRVLDLNMNVLVVDDFATIRRILRHILKQIGFMNISEAEDGKIALTELKNKKFDLVLCDWNMPEMSDLDLLNKVRSDDEL
jgi:two-component system chemotaxis response regulator CheY